MTGDCENCGKTTTEGIVVKGQAEGVYKVLGKVAGIARKQAIISVTDHAFDEFGERCIEVVETGEPMQLCLWICGDCAAKTGYKVGPMGTAVYREGVEGMGEVF